MKLLSKYEQINKNKKRIISVSDLREYEYCSISWCTTKGLGGHTKKNISVKDKKDHMRDLSVSDKMKTRGDIGHWLYEVKRMLAILFFLAIMGGILWILLKVI